MSYRGNRRVADFVTVSAARYRIIPEKIKEESEGLTGNDANRTLTKMYLASVGLAPQGLGFRKIKLHYG